MSERDIDIVVMGRVAVDLYSEQIQSPLKSSQTFRKYVGGCAGNIAIGTARLGLKSVMLSKVGNDEMGQFVLDTLSHEQVDTQFVGSTDEHLTGLVLLGVAPPDNFPLMFYREQCADMQLTAKDCDLPIWSRTKALLLTGTGFSTSQMRQASLKAISSAKQHGVKIIIDLDYRPTLWGQTSKGDGENREISSANVTKQYQMFLAAADVIVGTEEEWVVATGESDAAKWWQGLDDKICVIKKGAKGCTIYSPETNPLDCPGFESEVLNVLGAGDAFISGFLYGWLNQKPLKLCAHYANASGAIVVARHGCAPAMPYLEELEYFLTQDCPKTALASPNMRQLHRSQKHLPRFVLAFDHRWQFEKGGEKETIEAFKQAVFAGFEHYRQNHNSHDVGIIIDPIYGQSIINQCQQLDVSLAMPIEKAQTLRLSWLEDAPLYEQILKRPSSWAVKALCEYNIGMSDQDLAHQRLKARELMQVCESLDRALIFELISQDNVTAMSHFYEAGIYPTVWKIQAPKTKWEWEQISDLFNQYDPKAKVVVLGGAVSTMDDFETMFRLASDASCFHGFAVGRALFWDAWQRYSQGLITVKEVADEIQEKFAALVELALMIEQEPSVAVGVHHETTLD